MFAQSWPWEWSETGLVCGFFTLLLLFCLVLSIVTAPREQRRENARRAAFKDRFPAMTDAEFLDRMRGSTAEVDVFLSIRRALADSCHFDPMNIRPELRMVELAHVPRWGPDACWFAGALQIHLDRKLPFLRSYEGYVELMKMLTSEETFADFARVLAERYLTPDDPSRPASEIGRNR